MFLKTENDSKANLYKKSKGPKNRFVTMFLKTENDSKANDQANERYKSGGRPAHGLPA